MQSRSLNQRFGAATLSITGCSQEENSLFKALDPQPTHNLRGTLASPPFIYSYKRKKSMELFYPKVCSLTTERLGAGDTRCWEPVRDFWARSDSSWCPLNQQESTEIIDISPRCAVHKVPGHLRLTLEGGGWWGCSVSSEEEHLPCSPPSGTGHLSKTPAPPSCAFPRAETLQEKLI